MGPCRSARFAMTWSCGCHQVIPWPLAASRSPPYSICSRPNGRFIFPKMTPEAHYALSFAQEQNLAYVKPHVVAVQVLRPNRPKYDRPAFRDIRRGFFA